MPTILARCRGRELTLRRAAHAMLIAAGVLTCWVVYLALTLEPSEHRSHWVVLDVVEVIVLLVIARCLLHERRWRVVAWSLFAVPVFWYDAAIDITSSHRDLAELVIASMMAALVEVPAGAGMLFLAVRCACHRAQPSRAAEKPRPDRGATQTV